MSQGYYGNNGAGGYSNSQASGGGFSSPSRDQREILASLRPCTAKMVRDATSSHSDADFMIGNIPLGHLTVVGQALTITPGATNLTYWIDDGTGRVEARVWQESKVDEAMVEEELPSDIQEGAYVRVTGQLKQFNNKRYINAVHVRPVENDYEVYFHLSEVMTVTTMLERGMPGSKPINRASAVTSSYGADVSAYAAEASTSSTDLSEHSHRPPLHQKIIRFLANDSSGAEGVHLPVIAKTIGGPGISAQHIADALDSLMDDGIVFTTVTDMHYAFAQ